MRVINSSNSIAVGSHVVLTRHYYNGAISLSAGTKGIVTKISIESFPDLGLFDIKIFSFKFDKYSFAASEQVAKEYIKRI